MEVYGEDGTVSSEDSFVEDNVLSVVFLRDLYWPEDLVEPWMHNYKLEDPYEEYIALVLE